MIPYYENDFVKLYCGDCLNFTIPHFDALITDPPYGEDMGYDGDSPQEACSLLHESLGKAVDSLAQNGHVAIFWTMRNLDQVLDAVRDHGLLYRRTLSMYLPRGNTRPYLGWLPRVQPIVLSQKYLPKPPSQFHNDLAVHVSQQMKRFGFTNTSLSKEMNCDSRLIMKWSRMGDPAWCLPTPRFYPKLKELLHLDESFDVLMERKPQNESKRKFEYQHDCYVVTEMKKESFGHPSQKPLSVMRHLVNTLADEKETVLDLFSGSGTTLLAAMLEKRKAIGFEISERYCEIIARRLNGLKETGGLLKQDEMFC